ncbi:hypothetical protein C8F04DRAFT_1230406 [Mycena alexandri]|uniref:Restriction of telomere capping protein 4 C-terminal domain-containing protein n=1 Tax=Mycena alexandri TaxID=1745969 RepID=A0AAD6X6Y8_9AGAR|nr:hypothetical protein C8F04DRAFT_1230406 [Mycena alexandri]
MLSKQKYCYCRPTCGDLLSKRGRQLHYQQGDPLHRGASIFDPYHLPALKYPTTRSTRITTLWRLTSRYSTSMTCNRVLHYTVCLHQPVNTVKNLNEDADGVENELFATLSSLTDTPHNWDEYDDDSNLISLNKFTKFILIPPIAASLIADDLEIDVNQAIKVLEASEQYGLLFNGDPPEKIDILECPIYSQQAPPRLRPKLKLLLSDPALLEPFLKTASFQPRKQKMITLADYSPLSPPKPKGGAEADSGGGETKGQEAAGGGETEVHEEADGGGGGERADVVEVSSGIIPIPPHPSVITLS